MIWNRLFLALFTLLLASMTYAQDAPAACAPATGEPLRIGSVFPSETVFTASTTDPYRGTVAMVAAVNDCGGVAGRPLELIHRPAANRDETQAAVAQLTGDVPLIIGSGSPTVSEVLLQESRGGAFVYWEVSEALDAPHDWAFSPLLNNNQVGVQTAAFVQQEVIGLLAGEPLRVAIIHETRPAAQIIADALVTALDQQPVLLHAYTNDLSSDYTVAERIREQDVNVLVMVAFDNDSDQMWLSLRQADANVKAYIQVGGEIDRRNLCRSVGNSDGLMTISRTGPVNDAYRQQALGAFYNQYLAEYQAHFAAAPTEAADLSASATYLLLRHVLPAALDNFTAAQLQKQIYTQRVLPGQSLMGEGLSPGETPGVNMAGVAIVQQRQDNQFCSLFPSAVATCGASLQPFPTWRERVSQPQYATCTN